MEYNLFSALCLPKQIHTYTCRELEDYLHNVEYLHRNNVIIEWQYQEETWIEQIKAFIILAGG